MSKPVLKGQLWSTILQVGLVLVNVFTLLLCLAVFATGLWARLYESSYLDVTGELNITRTALALVVVGVFATCVSLMGIFGGIILKSILGRIVLCMYLFNLLLLIMSEVAAGAAALQYRHNLEENIENSTLETLDSMYADSVNTSWNQWDQFQKSMMCCGATNYSDFFPIFDSTIVPRSCCTTDAKQSGQCRGDFISVDTPDDVADIYNTPCIDVVVDHLRMTMIVLAVVALAISFLQVCGVVVSVLAIMASMHIQDKNQHSYRKLHQQTRGSSMYLST